MRNDFAVERIGFVSIDRARFFRHSPLTGANDEKSQFILGRLPRASLADSLCPGLSSGALSGLQMEKNLFYRAKRFRISVLVFISILPNQEKLTVRFYADVPRGAAFTKHIFEKRGRKYTKVLPLRRRGLRVFQLETKGTE